eukprot:COSAG02_NODE_44794_length_363_cov_0.564394_1_plen_28_part_01
MNVLVRMDTPTAYALTTLSSKCLLMLAN